jgi:hypothetical protein
LVDFTPLIDGLRQRQLGVRAVMTLLVILSAAVVCVTAIVRTIRNRQAPVAYDALVLGSAFTFATLVFGFYWNNSDDQFFFQLAIPTGAFIAAAGFPTQWRGAWAAALATVLAWNVAALIQGQILYPRWTYARAIEKATERADIILYPGRDELWRLLYFVPKRTDQRRLDIATIADKYPANVGIPLLTDSVDAAVARGDRIVVLGIFDPVTHQPPWKNLNEIGYTQHALQRAIFASHESCTRPSIGAFSVRVLVDDRTKCAP